MTRQQIFAEVNKSIDSALKLETDIRNKEKDLRKKMGEKMAVNRLLTHAKGSIQVDPSKMGALLRDLKD